MARGAHAPEHGDEDRVRIDRWLWAARFYKTRSQAAEAVEGGKVQVNDVRAKRAKPVAPGDRVRVRKPPFEYVVTVLAVSERRGGPDQARALYRETDESLAARERLRTQLRLQPAPPKGGTGRPTKKDRRALQRWKRDR